MKKVIAAAAALALSGCFHATSVEKPDQGGGSSEKKQGAQPKQKEGGPAAKPRAARRPERPGRPPLAADPSGLFVPGGVEQVQQALASRGYLDMAEVKRGVVDAPTSAAVRKFQTDQDIARTGNPDHETVRRLGLDADALFRKSSAVKKDSSAR
ncbi:MAG: peptidoglycan-binding domain-containing protein [Myxococcales bacterium]